MRKSFIIAIIASLVSTLVNARPAPADEGAASFANCMYRRRLYSRARRMCTARWAHMVRLAFGI